MLSHNEVQNPSDPRILEIIKAGIKNFERFGFRKASINDICADAGISKPTFYKHFSSKEELFFAVRVYLGGNLRKNFEKTCRKCGTATEKLHTYFRMLDEFSRSDKSFTETFDYNRELRKNWSYHQWGRDSYRNGVEIVEGIVTEGIAAGEFRAEDPRALAHKVVISVAMLGILRRSPPKFLKPHESIADFVFDLLLNGIKK